MNGCAWVSVLSWDYYIINIATSNVPTLSLCVATLKKSGNAKNVFALKEREWLEG